MSKELVKFKLIGYATSLRCFPMPLLPFSDLYYRQVFTKYAKVVTLVNPPTSNLLR